ncbi:MAG: DUF2285 domain-containing protein [Sphingomonadaceae bacterium]|nr:DUF2285 domain-containing protein [Sphingomonadaceae bacterium]
MHDSNFVDCPPREDGITAYDERHFVTYLRLLDADAEGADWREVVQIVFEIDPEIDSDRAKQLHQNHLERARWMTTNGYRHLLVMHKS